MINMTLATNRPNPGHSGHFAPFEFEIYGGLSPTNNPDTDQDELKDGKETNTYNTDPLNPDTDGDNVTDGKEINGYDLVWMETMSDGSVKDHKNSGVKMMFFQP